MRNRTARCYLIAAAAGLVTLGCGSGDAGPPAGPQVTVATPIQRDVRRYADFTGTTKAIEFAEIRARVSGVLEEMRFTPAQIVAAGQVLFVIEREQYQAAYEEALGSLRAAQAESSLAVTDLRRVEQAIQTDAVSESDLDRARANKDQADAAVVAARARRNNAQLNLNYTLVRTPVTGQIGRNLIDLGNLVGATGPELLTTVNRIDSLYVYFDASESVVLDLLAGAQRDTGRAGGERPRRVSVSLANETEFSHDGLVDFVDNTVDPSTGTIEVRAVLANPDAVMFPGLFVRIRAWGPVQANAFLVDERAVGTDLAGKYVLVVGDDNIVEQKYVTLGPVQDEGMIVVEGGLDGTERYIVNGLLRARPGFPVTPQTEAEVAQAQQAAMPAEEN